MGHYDQDEPVPALRAAFSPPSRSPLEKLAMKYEARANQLFANRLLEEALKMQEAADKIREFAKTIPELPPERTIR